VEGDAVSIINSLPVEYDDLSIEGHLLDEVKQFFKSFEFCRSHFVKREGTNVAHHLAKEALKVSQHFLCLESGPPWLFQCVSIDFQFEV